MLGVLVRVMVNISIGYFDSSTQQRCADLSTGYSK